MQKIKNIANVKSININLYENTIKSNDNGRKNCFYETIDDSLIDAAIKRYVDTGAMILIDRDFVECRNMFEKVANNNDSRVDNYFCRHETVQLEDINNKIRHIQNIILNIVFKYFANKGNAKFGKPVLFFSVFSVKRAHFYFH